MPAPTRITLSIIALALAACAAFVMRDALQRTLFVVAARRATGLDIDVARLRRVRDAYELEGVTAHTRGNAVLIEAPHVTVSTDPRRLAIDLGAARVTVMPDRLRGDEAARSLGALAQAGRSGVAAVTLHDATLTVASGAIPVPAMHFDGLSGSWRIAGTRVDDDVSLDLVDGERRYPIVGKSAIRADGTPEQSWSAAALPLASFGELFDPGGLRPVAGWLGDVTLDAGATLRAAAQLEGAGFTLAPHVLAGLHGPLLFADGGAGTRGVSGTLDGVPFDASGEVHDLGDGYGWLRAGSRDMQGLARVGEAIANEPQLRSVRIEATAPGVAFAQYALSTEHGPLAVSLLSIDPAEPTLRFDTLIAQDKVVSGGERTSAMGVRSHAIGGVNGDYFDIGRTYQPQGILVHGGTLLRGPTDRAVLAIYRDMHVSFEEFRLTGSVVTPQGTMPVTEFNDWPPGNVAIITPDYGAPLAPSSRAAFVGLTPAGASGTYRVASVVPPGGTPQLGFGIAIGERVRVALPHAGDRVQLTYHTDPPLDGIVAAIGGGPILLRDGGWYEDAHAPAPDERNYRWPVVALARRADDRLMLVAVDGRHPERSVGATRPEFAALLRRLGAVDAMALDSGGSVTLISRAPGDANASVRNVPSDNSAERWVSDALFLYSSAPAPTIVPVSSAPTPLPEVRPSP